jgi:hypothetical protein
VAAVDAQDWFINVVESKDGSFALDDTIAALKECGALAADNISKHSVGIYQSDTGEITMYSRARRMTVVTPRTEAVSMDVGGKLPLRLGSLSVLRNSVPACIAACAMSGEDLASSERMVLIYSTSVVNSHTILGPDRRLMISNGRSPVLLQAGEFALQLQHQQAGRLALYALGFDGQRTQKLPLDAKKDSVTIALNTADLENPSCFFELVVEQ